MRIVRIDPSHLAGVAALEEACFSEPWSQQSLALLCTDTAFGFVALSDEGEVLAYGGMLTVLDEGQITNVATSPQHRRCGLGAAVLDALMTEAAARGLSTLSLEVRAGNLAAISLYRQKGFEVAGRRPGFYTAPREDALVMIATL